MQRIIANIEIVLSVSWILLTVFVPRALGYEGLEFWIGTAVTAIGVGLFHSAVLWVVRRRQRLVRGELLLDAMDTLAAIRDEKLSEIMIRCEMVESTTSEGRAQLARIRQQAEQLWDEVQNLSTSLNMVYNEPQSREERIRYEPVWRPSPEV